MAGKDAYFIWGEESYLIDEKIKQLVANTQQSGEEAEVVFVEADEISAYELGETLEFSPLFSLDRVLILKKPSWLAKSVRRPKKVEEVLLVLEDYFKRDHPGQTLILTANELASSNKIAKNLSKWAEIIPVKKPTPAVLESWLKEICKQKEVQMEPVALKMAASSGQDMYYLEQLVDKLYLMYGKQSVGLTELEEELDNRHEIKVFKLTDALLNKNVKTSLEAFYQLLEQGQHHLLMLSIINRQFITLAKVKYYQEQGMPKQQVESMTGQKEYTVRKMMEKSSNFTWGEIRALFSTFLELDLSFKSESKDPRLLMETMIIKTCSS